MLESLIPSALRRKLLTIFFTSPGVELHIREACRRAGSQPNAVRAELENLEEAGILSSTRRGNLHLFSVNKSCPIFSELRMIILKTEGFAGIISAEFQKAGGIRLAFIYGSFAKNNERKGSDIDVLAIGSPEMGDLGIAVRKAEALLQREITCMVYPEKEFLAKIETGFISETVKSDKLWVIGGQDEFERFIEGRPHKKS